MLHSPGLPIAVVLAGVQQAPTVRKGLVGGTSAHRFCSQRCLTPPSRWSASTRPRPSATKDRGRASRTSSSAPGVGRPVQPRAPGGADWLRVALGV